MFREETLLVRSILESLLYSVGSAGAWVTSVAWVCEFVGGVSQILEWVAWVAWVHKILEWVKKMTWVAWVDILVWLAWVHKILAWVKKKA